MAQLSDRDFKTVSAEIILQNKSTSEFSGVSQYVVHQESYSGSRNACLTMKIEDDHLIHIRLPFEAARRIGEDLCRISSEKK
ncbi:MAG: hypothetical protein OXI87_15355 [Albidovulum sp.]|nr:hypothetical protein [Albidovulum sp.]MDE0306233.1 hypothetical protein [Albidovulum sp.]